MSDNNAFEPELGQMAWSNSPWEQIDADALLIDAIDDIAAAVYLAGLVHGKLTNNVGGQFECDTFKLRSYCWCDGSMAGHGGGCPPNFEWRDLRVRWYKYLGRGDSQNRYVSGAEFEQLRRECFAAIVKAYRAEQEEK